MKLTGYYTARGAAMTASALAQGTGLSITGVWAGSGNTDLSAAALTGRKQQLSLKSKRVNGEECVLEAELLAEDASEKYTLTEIGVFARLNGGAEQLYKLYRMDEGFAVEPGTDLSITFYLSEKIVPAEQVTVTVERQGYVTEDGLESALSEAAQTGAAALESHKTDALAHSALFAGKANAVHSHAASSVGAGTFSGKVAAFANTDYAFPQVRSVVLSQNDPTGGENGSLWIQYS